jgi:hypothetical protein
MSYGSSSVWDCPEAPAEASELDVFGALEVLAVPGTVACSECGADIALGPLVFSDLVARTVAG